MPGPETRSSRGDRKGRANRARFNERLDEERPRSAAERQHYKHHAPVQKGVEEKDWREGFQAALSPGVPRRQGHSPFQARQLILASARTLHSG